MKTLPRGIKLFLAFCFVLVCGKAFSQTNTFPTTGAAGIGTLTPNASSLLDITSTSKGMLIPRMTKSQRDLIGTPATGLLIYQTNNTPGFYYYDGGAWSAVTPKGGANKSLNNLTAPTAVNADLLPASTNSIDLGSAALNWKNIYAAGSYYIGASKVVDATGTGNSFIGLTGNTANTGAYNTAVGNGALFANSSASYNTATGYQSLYSNTSGLSNTADGWKALHANTTGYNNTAVGLNALSANTTGYKNTATGLDALYQNTTGIYNTAHGEEALYSNTTGGANTANGLQALYSNTDGSANTANGSSALYSNTTGYYNTADGANAVASNTTGAYNSGMGWFALIFNTTGSYNSAIGYNATPNAGNYDRSSAFGADALITASNQVRIGDNTITSIGGYTNWSNISDGRFKKNVKDNVKGLEFINKLQPVTYTLDITGADHFLRRDMPPLQDANGKVIAQPKDEAAIAAKEKIVYSGFIAQDVEKAAGEVGYDFSGVDAPKNDHDVYGLRYAEFVVPLVKAVQELSSKDEGLKIEDVRQNTELEKLKKVNVVLKLQNANLEARISSLEKSVTQNLSRPVGDPNSAMNNGFAELKTINSKPETLLGQNIPNPFDNSTLIPFRIPKNCHDASIMITNTSLGEVVSVIPVSCNEDHLSIDAGTLSSGTYSYTLYVDGKMIDTKQMVIQQ